MPELPIGNYYASLGNKYAYFYAAQCVNKNPEQCVFLSVNTLKVSASRSTEVISL